MPRNSVSYRIPPGVEMTHTLRGHEDAIFRIAWSPSERILASPSRDKTIRIWNASTGEHLRTLTGHAAGVNQVAWSPNGRRISSVSFDMSIWIWDVESGEKAKTIWGAHSLDIRSIAWSPDGHTLASGSNDLTIRLWHSETIELLSTLTGHSGGVNRVAWAPDGRTVASASDDASIRLWDAETGEVKQILEARFGPVHCVAWSPDGRKLASVSFGRAIRIWDTEEGRQTIILEGHTEMCTSVCFSHDGRLLASKSFDNTVRLWRCDTWETVAILDEESSVSVPASVDLHPKLPVLATLGEKDTAIRIWELDIDLILGGNRIFDSVEYANAKVVLVGDSGVGKTGLGLTLTGEDFAPTESTHGRHVWTFDTREVELDSGRKQTREILLWDLAGQPGYRVFHRQHLDEVAVALVLFDSRSETDEFTGIAYWARSLDAAIRGLPLVKFLVASRTDRGSPLVSEGRINEICERYGFACFLETSAKRGDGIKELRDAIFNAIDWDKMPYVSTPRLFYDIKEFIVAEKEAGRVLQQRRELLERFEMVKHVAHASEDAFDTCLGRIEASGLIKRLTFGSFVLLQPEMMDSYCAWLAQAARKEGDGLGFISDSSARAGDFEMDNDRPLKGRDEEGLLITATLADIVGRGIALRQGTEGGDMLVFPSELRTDMPDYPGNYVRAVTFLFDGPVRAIYATLVVYLTHTVAFSRGLFYRNAALFRSAGNEVCGLAVDYPDPSNDSLGRLTVFFDPETSRTTKLTFLRYINQQIERNSLEASVRRERIYQCWCGYVIPQEAIAQRKARGETTAICPNCGRRPSIDDLAEQSAYSDSITEEQIQLSDEERERHKRLVVFDERERGAEFHVFLCHNIKDKPEVRSLAEKLREQGILPWIDEQGILTGEKFIPELEKVIDEAPAAAVIVGAHWLGPWQQQEYYAFLQRFVEYREEKGRRRLSLIPVLLPGASAEPELPAFLRGFNWVDFRQQDGLENRKQMRLLIRAILAGQIE